MTTRKGNGDLGNNIPFKKPKLQMNPVDIWLEDSDDDDLILQASQAVEQNTNQNSNQLATPPNFSSFIKEFEKETRTSTQQQPKEEGAQPSGMSVNIAMKAKISSNLVLNQNKASQDFLRKRIETLEKDAQKAKDDCQLAVERIQIKEYEMSSLTYEMKELKRANNDLRLKLVKSEQFNKEIQRNKTLEKQLQKTETELELNRLELLKLKSDRRMSSQGLAALNVSIAAKADNPPELPKELEITVPLRCYETRKRDSWQFRLGYRIFENVPEELGTGTAAFVEQLSQLQHSMGLIFAEHPVDVQQFLNNTLEAMNLALNIISTKFDSSLQMYSSKQRSRGNILSDYHHETVDTRADACIFDKEALYSNEELITFRRILAIFALAVKFSSEICDAFYGSPVYDRLLAIIKGLSKTADEYQNRTSGVIQAAAVLLLNLTKGGRRDFEKTVNFIKALTFARLDSFSLFVIIKTLTKCLDSDIARKAICTSCEKREYYINASCNTALFTTNSCPLQVLATSLECTFPAAASIDYWTVERYRKLLALTRCVIRFFRQSMLDINTDWLTVDRSCRCYMQLTTSFIILTHLSLHLFQTVPKFRAEIGQIKTVSQLALLLIHDVFTSNCQMKLMHSLSRPIKNRLIVVYNLLMEYNKRFLFRLAQVKALDSFEVNLLCKSFHKSEANGSSAEKREKGNSIWDSISV